MIHFVTEEDRTLPARIMLPHQGEAFHIVDSPEENLPGHSRREYFTCAAYFTGTAYFTCRRQISLLREAQKRSTRLSASLDPGSCLSSRAVSSQVLSVYVRLTSVFGMGTGGTAQLNHRKGVVAKQLENCIFRNSL